ncbi:MAG: hypothetical protein AVDCRST_MAG56-5165 [uncultured Cytophagales bacterium]|uniref:Uncharacterized protein n=1 Tax=uncultured Cytophagales bacterium TaxID=158755 RepID=A0A6J4K5Z9_9SPHI|nr:MAG: hypothetical protein AVDCRST_MAG56-5165 [uncultured Cytophagales bacterium]
MDWMGDTSTMVRSTTAGLSMANGNKELACSANADWLFYGSFNVKAYD